MKALRINLLYLTLGLLLANLTLADDTISFLEQSWEKSRCSDFFSINAPEARFLARKCDGKKGRWLRACIRSKNEGGHFDEILKKFVIFHEWKCFSALSSYHAHKEDFEDVEENTDENMSPVKPLNRETIKNLTDVERSPVEQNTPPVSFEKKNNIYEMIERLQKKIKKLENRINKLETD